jgi:hypothetical protein
MVANNQQGRMWKEAVMASFKVLPQHFHGGLSKTTEISIRISGVQTEIQTGISQIHSHKIVLSIMMIFAPFIF